MRFLKIDQFSAYLLCALCASLFCLTLTGCPAAGGGGGTITISSVSSSPQDPTPGIPSASTVPLLLTGGAPSAIPGQTLDFEASGGQAPYTFSMVSGVGSINASTGDYTVPAGTVGLPRTDSIKVEDASGNTVSLSIRIHANGAAIDPNDTLYASEWGLATIKARDAWSTSADCNDIVIGVIDTGVDYTHSDLKNNLWKNPLEISQNGSDDDSNGYSDDLYGWDFANDDNDPFDDHYHGTHVAGTIGAVSNNSSGISGACWRSKLMILKFLDSSGSGTISDAIRAIDYATANGAKVTNNSWGGLTSAVQALQDAITRAQNAGDLFVVAAGNSGVNIDSIPEYPAAYNNANIISVGASTSTDGLAYYSNYGTSNVDLVAPGSSIYSTFPTVSTTGMRNAGFSTKNYNWLSGTSMAAPHVTGAAALVWSDDPSLTSAQVKSALLDNVDTKAAFTNKVLTDGRLNIDNAY